MMINFTNLRVGTRLTFGFGTVVFLLIGITILAATHLYSLKQTMETVIEVRYANVSKANVLHGEINRIAIAMRNALVVTELEQTNAEIAAIENARKTIDATFSQLEQALRDPEAKTIFEAMKVSREKYRGGQDEYLKLVKAGFIPDARELLLNTVIQLQRAYLVNVMDLVRLNERRMNESSAEVAAQYNSAMLIMMSLAGVALVLACGFGYWVTRSITRPLQQAVQVARTVSTGDLTSAIEVKSKDETGQLMLALKDMNDNLVRIVSQVRSGTETIATASGQIAVGNQDLSARTEEQAGSLEETASSMEELTSTVKQNADNARQANQLAMSASGVAERGGQAMSGVVSTMGEINDSAKKIVEIISVIDGIAFQTNILALNAAVEAARAGEQGRGFAVVATEVRNLAQRSAAAAKDIKTLIGASVEKIGAGTQLVDRAGATMNEVVISIKQVTDIMQEITAASNEQSAGIEQVNQAIIHMDQATQQNAALVEQAAAAATSLQEQAGNLSQLVDTFKFEALQNAGSGMAATAAIMPPVSAPRLERNAAAPRSKSVAAKLPARTGARAAPIALSSNTTDEWEQF